MQSIEFWNAQRISWLNLCQSYCPGSKYTIEQGGRDQRVQQNHLALSEWAYFQMLQLWTTKEGWLSLKALQKQDNLCWNRDKYKPRPAKQGVQGGGGDVGLEAGSASGDRAGVTGAWCWWLCWLWWSSRLWRWSLIITIRAAKLVKSCNPGLETME